MVCYARRARQHFGCNIVLNAFAICFGRCLYTLVLHFESQNGMLRRYFELFTDIYFSVRSRAHPAAPTRLPPLHFAVLYNIVCTVPR